MKKTIFLFIALCLTWGMAVANAISIQMVLPADMIGGETYDVEVKINKGNLGGFARFHQDLPLGFVAEEIQEHTEGAVFSFDDQRLRFIWASLPNDNQFTIKYRLRVVEPRIQGRLQLVGRFTYVLGDERQTVDVESSVTNISPASNVPTSDIIDIELYQKGGFQPSTTAASLDNNNIFAVRQKPYSLNGEWIVNLQITKGNLNGLGQLEEEAGSVSLGKIVNIESQGAITKINNNRITYAWMQLPPDSNFIVSYKIIPTSKKANLANIPIQGLFTYGEDGQVTSIDVVERDVDFSSNTIAQARSEQYFNEEIITPSTTIPQSSSAKSTQPKNQNKSMQKGLVFKVQVLATRQTIGDANLHFSEFNLGEPVIEEYTNDDTGFSYKYVIGPFNRYEQAVHYKENMWRKGITDAFVTSYYNGRRISTQEALMISHKKR